MKKYILFVATFMILLSSCIDSTIDDFSSDQELYRVQRRGKWGFINKDGEIIIRPKYKWALDFSDGLAPVQIGNKMGYINEKGDIVIKPIFDFADVFNDGLAIIRTGKHIRERRYGFIDTEGNIVIEQQFQSLYPFSDELAMGLKDDKWLYIDKSGNVVLEEQFDSSSNFSEGLASFKSNGKYGYINKKGEVVIDAKFEGAFPFSDGLALVNVMAADYPENIPEGMNLVHLSGYIDITGRFVIEPQYVGGSDFKNGIAIVSKGADKMAIDKNGNVLFKLPPWGFRYFREGFAAVSINIGNPIIENFKWGFIDTNGELLIEHKFDEVGDFYKGIARVRMGEKWGYINTSGDYIWKPTK
ncbi:UNVERIFIED_CONTAM: WG repeat protein [Acetivibrio alkalicellulosi]